MGRHNADNRSVGAVGITGKLLGLLGSESAYLKVIVLYGVVVSLLALAVPFAIQILINLLVIGGLFHPVVTATAVTFGLLVVSGGLYLVQVWMAEKLKRRVFVRFSSLIVLRVLNTSKSTWSQLFPSNIGDRFFEIPVIQKTLAKIGTENFEIARSELSGSEFCYCLERQPSWTLEFATVSSDRPPGR